jgi:hypothetical protein
VVQCNSVGDDGCFGLYCRFHLGLLDPVQLLGYFSAEDHAGGTSLSLSRVIEYKLPYFHILKKKLLDLMDVIRGINGSDLNQIL